MKFVADRYILTALSFWFFALLLICLPPYQFPPDSLVTINQGETITGVAGQLQNQSIITSRLLFRGLVALLSPETGVVAGEYSFTNPASLVAVVKAVTDPNGGGRAVRLTFPEGLNNRELAEIARKTLGDDFKVDVFLQYAAKYEGYLFPETYFVAKSIDEGDLVKLMRRTFDERIVEIESDIASSTVPFSDLVIMASILHGEAYTEKTMQKVAGVLWNRISLDMPLQVDAVFKYFLGRTTFELTLDDLGHESTYNTYKNKGLPPTPINNPGLAAIRAAANPAKIDALFYLTGRDGMFYFSKTFDEHKSNKFKYLR
ncbi:MAG: endolytic transglycosylase MltG [bacterium]|nr:endolytic transglycosylase MltG [bacterium]